MPSHNLSRQVKDQQGLSSGVVAAPNPWEYTRLRALGIPAAIAKVQAGYSPKTSSAQITRTIAGQMAALSVEEQRAKLREIPGYTLHDCMHISRVTRDRPKQNPETILHANAQIIDTLGMQAPKQVVVNEYRQVSVAVAVLHDIARYMSINGQLPPMDGVAPEACAQEPGIQ